MRRKLILYGLDVLPKNNNDRRKRPHDGTKDGALTISLDEIFSKYLKIIS